METAEIYFRGTTEELLINKTADLVVSRITQLLQKPQPERKRLSKKQTAERLNISLPTLDDWSLKGYLKRYRIGGRVYYFSDEVDKAGEEVKNLRYRRAV